LGEENRNAASIKYVAEQNSLQHLAAIKNSLPAPCRASVGLQQCMKNETQIEIKCLFQNKHKTTIMTSFSEMAWTIGPFLISLIIVPAAIVLILRWLGAWMFKITEVLIFRKKSSMN